MNGDYKRTLNITPQRLDQLLANLHEKGIIDTPLKGPGLNGTVVYQAWNTYRTTVEITFKPKKGVKESRIDLAISIWEFNNPCIQENAPIQPGLPSV